MRWNALSRTNREDVQDDGVPGVLSAGVSPQLRREVEPGPESEAPVCGEVDDVPDDALREVPHYIARRLVELPQDEPQKARRAGFSDQNTINPPKNAQNI